MDPLTAETPVAAAPSPELLPPETRGGLRPLSPPSLPARPPERPPVRQLPLTRPVLWQLSALLTMIIALFFLAGVIVGIVLMAGDPLSPPEPMASGPIPSSSPSVTVPQP